MKKIYLAIVLLLIIFAVGISYLYSKNSTGFKAPMSADELQDQESGLE